jgi:hypothetical protein
MTAYTNGESLYDKAPRLQWLALYSAGTGPESQHHTTAWLQVVDEHPDIVSQLADPLSEGPLHGSKGSNVPWNEAEENARFVGTWHWNVCRSTMPVSNGFRADINALIRAMCTHLEKLQFHQSTIRREISGRMGFVPHAHACPTVPCLVLWS